MLLAPGTGILFRGAADLTDHDHGFGVRVVVEGDRVTLWRIERGSGRVAWKGDLGSAEGHAHRKHNMGTPSPVVGDGLVFVMTGNGALKAFALENKIDLTVVGPEEPLTLGIVDEFEAAGLRIFGPNREAARMEGSKAFAKAFMARHNIPTAPFEIFDEVDAALAFVADSPWGYPVVVKADGLAAGKGVIICEDADEAAAAVQAAMGDSVFGRAGDRLVVEAFMSARTPIILLIVAAILLQGGITRAGRRPGLA